MPSPFPGMNPYIERKAVWHDFHLGYIAAIKTALVPQVRPEYYAKIDDHIYDRTVEEGWYEERVRFIEIFEAKDHAVVTVIEILSPTVKRNNKEREQFIARRKQILESSVHYVEIDLLRAGRRMTLEGMPPCDYCVLVRSAQDHPEVGFWPISLRDPLPVIPIPVSRTKANAQIALQDLLHQVYDGSAYGDYIYKGPPEPRLRHEDEAWAMQLLANS